MDARATPQPAGLILVVDDSRVVRRIARRILHDAGFAVEEAENGVDALQHVRRQRPDAVLLDWNMPVMNGIECLRALRREFGADEPRVIPVHHRERTRFHRHGDLGRSPGIHHEAVRRRDPARQARAARSAGQCGVSAATIPDRGERPSPIRVLVCDDSFTIRAVIARILRADPEIEVAGLAADGAKAADALRRGGIEIVVLDVEMPVMDGLTALPLLLKIDPTVRVIMASALTTSGGGIAMQALQAGAADYVPKPAANQADEFAREILAKVKGQARLRRHGIAGRTTRPTVIAAAPSTAPVPAPAPGYALRPAPARPALLLAIGSSTGGPQALFSFFRALDSRLPIPIIVTQHMPPVFTRSLAEHHQPARSALLQGSRRPRAAALRPDPDRARRPPPDHPGDRGRAAHPAQR